MCHKMLTKKRLDYDVHVMHLALIELNQYASVTRPIVLDLGRVKRTRKLHFLTCSFSLILGAWPIILIGVLNYA